MPRGLTNPQIADILYDDNVTELGDSELSDNADDPDYMESDNERHDESEDDCGGRPAPDSHSSKRKRDHRHVLGASSLPASHPLHDNTRPTNTACTSQAQQHTVNTMQTIIADAQWEWTEGNEFSPTHFQFDLAGCGIPHGLIPDRSRESEYFRLFFTEEILDHIVKETNKFFGFMIAGKILHPHSRFLQWHDTDRKEMYSFLALVMLMGLSPRQNYKDYWSTDPLLHWPMFSKSCQ